MFPIEVDTVELVLRTKLHERRREALSRGFGCGEWDKSLRSSPAADTQMQSHVVFLPDRPQFFQRRFAGESAPQFTRGLRFDGKIDEIRQILCLRGIE